MRRALIGLLMAATVASPLAAQTSDSSTKRRGGFSAAVRGAVQNERSERRQERTEQRTERREDRQEQRQSRRDDRAAQSTTQATQRTTRQDRPRTWGQSVNNAIRSEQRQERRQDRLERREDRRDYRAWRNDRRYDWQRYRNYNRGLFNIGRYYSPVRGYGYNRFSIGVRLGSPFYSDRYWIQDPWQYRLPPAYAGTRWVRYYDDVLLVDMYTGEVLDVIHNFFW